MAHCRRLTTKLGLEKIVNFNGWCTTKVVEQAYQNSHIFVFPSFREPTGGVILEAIAHGLPCVTCDYGGPNAILTNEAGKLIQPAPPEEYAVSIAKAIDGLIQNPSAAKKLAENAAKLANSRYLWEAKIKRIESIYREAVLNQPNSSL